MTGWTALHEAACNGRLNVAQVLLHLGADIHSRTNEGDTALHKAARWGRVDIVKLLLLVGADARAKDKVLVLSSRSVYCGCKTTVPMPFLGKSVLLLFCCTQNFV